MSSTLHVLSCLMLKRAQGPMTVLCMYGGTKAQKMEPRDQEVAASAPNPGLPDSMLRCAPHAGWCEAVDPRSDGRALRDQIETIWAHHTFPIPGLEVEGPGCLVDSPSVYQLDHTTKMEKAELEGLRQGRRLSQKAFGSLAVQCKKKTL